MRRFLIWTWVSVFGCAASGALAAVDPVTDAEIPAEEASVSEATDVDPASQEDLARYLEQSDLAVPPSVNRKPAVLGAATQEPTGENRGMYLDYSDSNEVITDSIETRVP